MSPATIKLITDRLDYLGTIACYAAICGPWYVACVWVFVTRVADQISHKGSSK